MTIKSSQTTPVSQQSQPTQSSQSSQSTQPNNDNNNESSEGTDESRLSQMESDIRDIREIVKRLVPPNGQQSSRQNTGNGYQSHRRQNFPSQIIRCYTCHRRGHIQRNCWFSDTNDSDQRSQVNHRNRHFGSKRPQERAYYSNHYYPRRPPISQSYHPISYYSVPHMSHFGPQQQAYSQTSHSYDRNANHFLAQNQSQTPNP